jgi:hypothetical protein
VKAFLDNFAAILGTITVAMLVMSVSHEYGYFWSIGRQFQTFLTTNDYLANAVLWLPPALFFIGLTIQYDIRGGLPKKNNLTKQQKRLSDGLLVAFVLCGLAMATWPMNLLAGIWLILWGGLAWAWMSRRFSKAITSDDPFQVNARMIRFGPPVILAVFLIGSIDANCDLNRTDNPYAFEVKNDDTPKQRIFLRNFDKGVLVRNTAERTIEFYKWDDIAKISRAVPKPSASYLCWRFGLMCEISATSNP